jgi:hypothetical protein
MASLLRRLWRQFPPENETLFAFLTALGLGV